MALVGPGVGRLRGENGRWCRRWFAHGAVWRLAAKSAAVAIALSCSAGALHAQETSATAANAEHGQTVADARPTSDPLLAHYDGGKINFVEMEQFVREMPMAQRIPFASAAGDWRRFMCGELAKMTALTSQALTLGLNLDPGWLRARDYFLNEYLCYLVLRDNVENRINYSPALQAKEYETHKADFWVSPTVSLRLIRSQDADQISSAAALLKGGADFAEVEEKYSQVSPRYKGRINGPYPSRKKVTQIPPPPRVIAAAMAQPEGSTTGPLTVGAFHYLVKTVHKTAGYQQRRDQVTQELIERVRAGQSARLVPELIDRVQKELGVVVDEQLFASGSTNANDLLATVGVLKIRRQEYDDLNGNVRGPATAVAMSMPTKLKQFVTPYMLAEWARAHGYQDREETKRAVHYYDLQHLAAKVEMELGLQLLPLPTDEQLRAQFQKNINAYRKTGQPEPRFEDHKQEMMDVIIQDREEEAERRVRSVVLQKLQFQPEPHPVSTEITAFEAVVKISDQLTSGRQIISITPLQLPAAADGSTPYAQIGRASRWQIVVRSLDKTTLTLTVDGPAPLLQGAADYAKIPAMERLKTLWRFDTDSLKRHAIDGALGNFKAKYHDRVRIGCDVIISVSNEDPTSPTECLMIYRAVPLDPAVDDGLAVSYSGYTGDVVNQQLGSRQWGGSLSAAEAKTGHENGSSSSQPGFPGSTDVTQKTSEPAVMSSGGQTSSSTQLR